MKRPDTRQQILELAENLIRSKGYNSFSYHEIAVGLGIKNAAIHYHFPTKEVLGLEVIRNNIQQFKDFEERVKELTPEEQLDEFIQIYDTNCDTGRVCLVGAISVEYFGLPENMTLVMQGLTQLTHSWLTRLMKAGQSAGAFHFRTAPAQKALMIITNLAAGIQLARFMGRESFREIIKGLKYDLYSQH